MSVRSSHTFIAFIYSALSLLYHLILMHARFVSRVPRKVIGIETTHPSTLCNSSPRTCFAGLLCQACKAVITRHVVSVEQIVTGTPSRSRLISTGDSIVRQYRSGDLRENAPKKSEKTHETRFRRIAICVSRHASILRTERE
jgi:hypothetical protein